MRTEDKIRADAEAARDAFGYDDEYPVVRVIDATFDLLAEVADLRRRLNEQTQRADHAVQAERLRTSQCAVERAKVEAARKIIADWANDTSTDQIMLVTLPTRIDAALASSTDGSVL